MQILRDAETLSENNQAANIATNENRGNNQRGQDRRGRGGNRRRGRGGIHRNRPKSRGDSRGRGRSYPNNFRGRNNGRGKVNNRGRDNCGFCYQPGHWQKDCPDMKAAQNRLFEERSTNQNRGFANVAREHQQYNRDDYLLQL
ncbi:hypothetical protein K3495_g17263 [Podosphaera aphanis]|nr:hypothetical protein K3495_g17263 [Podosphaera aphanis]